MEISGRLQVAKRASMEVIQKNKMREFVDEPGWALKKDRYSASLFFSIPQGVEKREVLTFLPLHIVGFWPDLSCASHK